MQYVGTPAARMRSSTATFSSMAPETVSCQRSWKARIGISCSGCRSSSSATASSQLRPRSCSGSTRSYKRCEEPFHPLHPRRPCGTGCADPSAGGRCRRRRRPPWVCASSGARSDRPAGVEPVRLKRYRALLPDCKPVSHRLSCRRGRMRPFCGFRSRDRSLMPLGEGSRVRFL